MQYFQPNLNRIAYISSLHSSLTFSLQRADPPTEDVSEKDNKSHVWGAEAHHNLK